MVRKKKKEDVTDLNSLSEEEKIRLLKAILHVTRDVSGFEGVIDEYSKLTHAELLRLHTPQPEIDEQIQIISNARKSLSVKIICELKEVSNLDNILMAIEQSLRAAKILIKKELKK